ncbi:MAG: peptidoglycan-binding protein, partial [Clostridia bacterium]|nr:peptidoglycan-binding protein [Clostridia bacterium]
MKLRKTTAILLVLVMLLGAAQSALAVHKHQWREASRTEATCTKKGKITYRCSCGETMTKSIKKKPHDWSKWKTTEQATCEKKGKETRKCKVCGKKDERDTSRLPHSWGEWMVTEEATDFSMGTHAHTCETCGTEESASFYPDPTYKRGDKGSAVKELQQKLNDAGYDCGKPDGSYGGKTVSAVMAIESAHGVEPDGIAWPGVQKWLEGVQGSLQQPEGAQADGLTLTVALSSDEQDAWRPGDEVSFDWTLVNNGAEDLVLDNVFMNWGDEGMISLSHGPAQIAAGGGTVLSDTWTAELDGEWLSGDAWNLVFYGRGYAAGEEDSEHYTASNKVVIKLASAALKDSPENWQGEGKLMSGPAPSLPPDLTLPSDRMDDTWRSLEIIEQTKNEDDYYDGAKIPVKMRLNIDAYDSYRFVSITVDDGDSVSDMDWTENTLEAGHSYSFTYTMSLNPKKAGWKTRNVTIKLLSLSREAYETESCEVRPPFTNPKVTLIDPNSHVIDAPAFIYLTVEKESLSAFPAESMDIPIKVTTNAADDFSNVALVCDTDVGEKGFYRDTKKLAKKMAAHETRTFLCNLPVRTVKDVWEGYTVTLYVTGEVLNVKGKVENIVSLPVTLPLQIQDPDKQGGKLQLTYALSPGRSTYLLNDRFDLRLYVRNTGQVPVDGVKLAYAEDFAFLEKLLGKIDPLPGGGLIGPGEQRSITLNYKIRPEDAKAKEFHWGFVANGTVQGTQKPVRSNVAHVDRKVSDQIPEPSITLSASAVEPKAAYPAETAVYAKLTIQNDTERRMDAMRIYAVGDNRHQTHEESAPWFDLGHGVKGWQCLNRSAMGLEPGKSTTVEVPVVIPGTFAEGEDFVASWAVDADLAEGTPVRSNIASLVMPVGSEPKDAESVLKLSVEQINEQPDPEGWKDGDQLAFKVSAVCSGPVMPESINAFMTYLDETEVPLGYKEETNTWNLSDVWPMNLDASHASDGECSILFDAYASLPGDGNGVSAIPVVLTYQVAEKGAFETSASENGKLKLQVTTLTDCPDPAHGWLDGQKVLFGVRASYEGEEMPYSIEVDVTDAVETSEPLKVMEAANNNVLTENCEIALNADHAADGKCVYNFTAYAYSNPDTVECYTDTISIPFPMAPSGEGPDELTEEEGGPKIETKINWDAVNKGKDEAEHPETEGDEVPSADGEDDEVPSADGIDAAVPADPVKADAKKAEDGKPADTKKTEDGKPSDTEKTEDGKPADTEKTEDGEPTDTEKTEDGEPSDTEKTEDGEPSDTEKTEDGEPTDTEKTEDGEPADTEKTEDGKPADTEKTEDGKPADTEKTEDGKPADTEKTEDGEPSDTEKTEDEKPADTEKTEDGEPSDTEKTEDGKPADTEKTEDDKPADTEKTEVSIPADPLKIDLEKAGDEKPAVTEK